MLREGDEEGDPSPSALLKPPTQRAVIIPRMNKFLPLAGFVKPFYVGVCFYAARGTKETHGGRRRGGGRK